MKNVKMTTREKWTLTVLVLMSVFLFADQNAMNPVIKDIMAEYKINESQVGAIGSAFTILGAVVTIFLGYFTDKFSRKKLLAIVVIVGTIPCFMTGFKIFTGTYNQLMLLRILTGIGVGGIFPITFSLIGDYFDSSHRAKITAIVTTSWGIGQILGQMLSGFLSTNYGWRFAFLIAATPNFFLIPAFLKIAREPKRGAREEEISDMINEGIEYKETIKLGDIKTIFMNKTNWLGFIQGIPGCIPWGIIPFFITPFYQDKGFSREFATTLTVILGAGGVCGAIFGGWMGDRIYQRSKAKLPIFAAAAVLTGVIPGSILMTLKLTPGMGSSAMITATIACFITGFVITIPGPNVKAILLNVNPPEQRGSVFAIHNLTDSIGKGVGPIIGGVLITSHGYLYTMLFSVYMWIPCAIIYILMAFTLNKDVTRLKDYLTKKRNGLFLN